MDPHELLIRHAIDWARQRSRPLDPEILSEALMLHEQHGGHPAQEWPGGSVHDLMLVLWPGYGSSVEPEPLQETLDTYIRFLRATVDGDRIVLTRLGSYFIGFLGEAIEEGLIADW